MTIKADQTEEFAMSVSAPESPGRYRLEFLVYRATGTAKPYKRVYLNVEVRGE